MPDRHLHRAERGAEAVPVIAVWVLVFTPLHDTRTFLIESTPELDGLNCN